VKKVTGTNTVSATFFNVVIQGKVTGTNTVSATFFSVVTKERVTGTNKKESPQARGPEGLSSFF